MRRRTAAEKLADERERANDLDFLEEVRQASMKDLARIMLNLSFGGPEWQRVAVNRALERAMLLDVARGAPSLWSGKQRGRRYDSE